MRPSGEATVRQEARHRAQRVTKHNVPQEELTVWLGQAPGAELPDAKAQKGSLIQAAQCCMDMDSGSHVSTTNSVKRKTLT